MIDAATVEGFQRDGAACIRQLFRPEEVALLRAGIDEKLAHLSPRAKVASGANDPGYFVEDFCNWQDNADYRHFIFDSPLPETAGRLMRSTTARLYHDHMLTKEPGTRQPTPWHQDQPYYNIEGRQNASFWIPVDPVSRASTLELIAGSHLGPGLLPRPSGGEIDRRRRVFSVRFLGDDIVHATRAWKTSPEFPGLREMLPAGE